MKNMEELLFYQNFNYVAIKPDKNYCLLSDRDKFIKKVDTLKKTYIYNSNLFFDVYDKLDVHYYNSKEELPKKNTRFFYLENNIESVEYPSNKWYFTKKDRHIKKYYGDPFTQIHLEYYTKKISKKGDEIKFTISIIKKYRLKNYRYFKKEISIFGFKLNIKTGNFTTYSTTMNKKNRLFRVNSFFTLFDISKQIENVNYLSKGNLICKADNKIMSDYYKNFGNDEFNNKMFDILLSIAPFYSGEVSNIENLIGKNNGLLDLVTQFFIRIKDIKVPNNYIDLLVNHYPTQKYLKKNDNKLIAAILDRLNIKSKTTIKLVHNYKNYVQVISRLKILIKLIGVEKIYKYINNIDTRFFSENWNDNLVRPNRLFYYNNLTDLEKRNLLMILNHMIVQANLNNGSVNFFLTNYLNELFDHLFMLSKVKHIFEDTTINATTLESFNNEHMELTKIYQQVKKGYYIEYVFEENLIEYIKEPIHTNDGSFYPYLLTNDSEYSKEGTHMHHCVASYSERTDSVIISLREGGFENKERVTSEYDTKHKSCVQSKYFCNAEPPPRFKPALEILNKRISNWNGSIKSLEMKKIKIDPSKKLKIMEDSLIDFDMFDPF